MHLFLNKKFLIIFTVIVTLSFFAKLVLATPPASFFTPGETLNPTCSPTDLNCEVAPPLTAVNIDDTAYGVAWDTDTTHAPSKNAVYDKIETLATVSHNAVTIGAPANGLSLATQVLSLALASTSTTGALSNTDWNTFNNKLSTATAASTYIPYTGGTANVDLGIHNLTVDTNTFFVDSVNHWVGIGTTVPTNHLSFSGTGSRTIGMERHTEVATAGQRLTLSSGAPMLGETDLDGGDLRLKSGTSTGTGTSVIRFYTATAGATGTTDNTSTEKMTILGNGNVGIGTTIPVTKLQVYDDHGAGEYLDARMGGTYGLYLDVSDPVDNMSGQALGINLNSPIFPGGVAISITSTSQILSGQSSGITTGDMIALTQDASAFSGNGIYQNFGGGVGSFTGNFLKADVGSVNKFKVDYLGGAYFAGSVGIGNTAPGELLTLGTAGTTAGVLSLAGATSGKAIIVVSATAGTPTLTLPTTTGTLALVSDLTTGYVPYTGATTDVDLGTHSLTTPLVIGGSSTTQDLTFKTTTGIGATGADMHFLVGNNGATEAMTILNNGNVGIGTTAPQTKLHVSGTSLDPSGTAYTGIFTLLGSSTATLSIGSQPLGPYGFWLQTGDTTLSNQIYPLLLNPLQGNVGIGTTAPSEKLHVYGGIKATGELAANTASSAGLEFTGGSSRIVSWGVDAATRGGFQILQVTSNGISPLTSLAIDSTGNVGIGTAAPGSLLHLTSTNPELRITPTATGIASINLAYLANEPQSGVKLSYDVNAAQVYFDSKYLHSAGQQFGDIQFRTTPSIAGTLVPAMTIQSTGNVGIGTTSPVEKLNVVGNIRTTGSVIVAANEQFQSLGDLYVSAASGSNMYFRDGSSTNMFIENTGKVGIGTTTPGSLLNIKGAGTVTTPGSTLLTLENSHGNSNDQFGILFNNTGYTGTARIESRLNGGGATSDLFFYAGSETARKIIHFDGASGRLGINKADPTTTLDVNGGIALTGDLLTNGSASFGTTTLDGILRVSGPGTATPGTPLLNINNEYDFAGSVFGLSFNSKSLGYAGESRIMSTLGSGGLLNDLLFYTGNSTGAAAMRIDYLGNVGIGTTSPTDKLTIFDNNTGYVKAGGTSFITGTLFSVSRNAVSTETDSVVASIIQEAATDDQGALYIRGDSDTANTLEVYSKGIAGLVVNPLGNVGIGTTNPLYKLDVNGTGHFSGVLTTSDFLTTTGTFGFLSPYAATLSITSQQAGQTANFTAISPIGKQFIFSSGDTLGLIQTQPGVDLALSTGNTERMRILATSGNVGIGTISPSGILSVTPTQYSTGTASQSLTTVTGVGTVWTSAMVGSQFVFANGTSAGTITAFNSITSLTVSTSQTVTSQAYNIAYTGLQVGSTGNLGIGTSPYFSVDIRTPSASTDFVHIGQDATFGAFLRGAGNSTAGSAFLGNFLYNTTTPASSTSAGGTATADGIYFDNGIHFLSNDSIAGAFTPAERLTIKNSGNVGIGTTVPTDTLTVVGENDSSPILTLSNDTNLTNVFNFTRLAANGALSIQGNQTGFNNILLAPTSGNVGIGTTNPTYKLQVAGASYLVGQTLIEGGNLGLNSGGSGVWAYLAQNAAGDILFQDSNAATKMIIQQAGNVGIGTTAPGVLLDVSSGGWSGSVKIGADGGGTTRTNSTDKYSTLVAPHYLNAEQNITTYGLVSSAANSILDFGGGIADLNSVMQIGFFTAADNTTLVGTERMRIQPNGNVGIGTTAPTGLLHLSGSQPKVFYTDTSAANQVWSIGPADNYFSIIGKDNARDLTVSYSYGNTGIGQPTPTANLEVAQPTNGRGTVSTTATLTTVTGVGTQFLNTFKVGDTITVNAETRTIATIASNTSLTTDAWTGSNVGVAYTLVGGTRFSVLGNGNVGIGTVAPSYPLDVTTGTTFTNGGIRTKYALRFGSNTTTAPVLFPFLAAAYTVPDPTGKGLGFYSYSGTAGDMGIGFSGDNLTNTTGGYTNAIFARTFAPTSGTGTYANLNLGGTINQTGGANGITRGLYISPNLTAAADWRAIETSAGSLVMNDTYLAGSGALAGSLLNLTQTWNTTGTPTAIKLNVTNTASNAASLLMDLQVGGASKFSVTNAGVVQQKGCITAGTLSADVSGNIICTPSSARFKNNITDLNDSLANIMALRPVSYNFNSDMNLGDGIHLGFISEEVALVVPEFATHDIYGNPYGLDTSAILAGTVKAIQEMNLKIKDINNIEKENDWRDSLIAWFANATNGIAKIFTGEIETKSLCVSDDTGAKTCITKEQLDALLLNAGAITTPPPSDGGTPPPQGGEEITSPPSEGGVPAPSEGGGNSDPAPVDPAPTDPTLPTSEGVGIPAFDESQNVGTAPVESAPAPSPEVAPESTPTLTPETPPVTP